MDDFKEENAEQESIVVYSTLYSDQYRTVHIDSARFTILSLKIRVSLPS